METHSDSNAPSRDQGVKSEASDDASEEVRRLQAELNRTLERESRLREENERLYGQLHDQESKRRACYAAVVDMMSDCLYVEQVAPDGTARCEWIGGRVPEALEAHAGEDALVPEDVPVARARRAAIEEGSEKVSEFRVVTSDGDERWLRDHMRPMWDDAEQRVTRVYGAVQDITDRRSAQEALRESRQQLKDLMDNLEGIVFECDARTGRFNFVSRRAEDLLGYPIARWKREDDFWIDRIVHPEDRERVAAAMRRELENGKSCEVAFRAVRSDGEVVWLRAIHQTVFDDEGEPELIRGLMIDITERKWAEEALMQSQAMLQLVLDNIPQGVFWKDREGRYLGTNIVAARSMGLTEPEEAIGLSPFDVDVYTPEQAAAFDERDRRVVEREEPQLGVVEQMGQPDGATAWIRTNKVPMRDAKGEVVGMLGTWEDITEQKKMEEELRELNERLEERVQERTEQVRRLASRLTLAEQRERKRIANILHDHIQQLLYGMEMSLRRLRRQCEQLPDRAQRQAQQTYLDQLEETLDEALRDTRTLSVELSPPIASGEDLGTALEWLAHHMRERYGLEIDLELEEGFVVPSENLRTLLFQVARELLFNVVKHAEVKEAVVYGRREEDRVVLDVADSGKGFDPNAMEQQPESRGLHNMRNRLALLDGEIELETAPSEGTRVMVQVPLQT